MDNSESIPTARSTTQSLRLAILCVLLVAATLWVYYPVNRFDFLNYDDNVVVTDNVHIKYGLSWAGVKWAFTQYRQANWVPLTFLSHALDCEMFGLRPGPHHDTNLLLHVIDVLLLFWVLRQATGYTGRSFMVAALFALHPINVESVAWIASRRNMLSMLFFLLGLGAYRWYVLKPKIYRYLLIIVLFALGFMSKAQVLTFPFVLLLWDYWPLRRMFANSKAAGSSSAAMPARSLSWLVVEKLPLFALAAVGAFVTAKIQVEGGGINPNTTLALRLENALLSYVRYVAKAFWPAGLANLYPVPVSLLKLWQVFGAFFFLLAITALVVVAARQRRYLLVGWLWFLGTMVPMIGLMQLGRHAMADRYAYLPFIGLFIMVCWGAGELYDRMAATPGASSADWMARACAVLLLVLAMVAHRQVGYWENSETLWTHTIQVTSGNYQAEDNLASELMFRGQYHEALEHLRVGEGIDPSYPLTHFHIGLCEQQLGNLPAAVEQYKKVIDLTESDLAHNSNIGLRHAAFENIAVAYRDLGDSPNYWQYREAANDLARQYGKP